MTVCVYLHLILRSCLRNERKEVLTVCRQFHGPHMRKQESRGGRAVAREPRDAAAVFGLKFADNIHYKFKSSKASKARLQSSKRTGAKQNLTQNGHSRSLYVSK